MYLSILWFCYEKRRCKIIYMVVIVVLSCGLVLMTMECLEEFVVDLMMLLVVL